MQRLRLDSCPAWELDQLRETFADVAEIPPKYRDLSILDLMMSMVKDPLAALDGAIQTKDAQQFAAAYVQLTAACNVCHQPLRPHGDRDPAAAGRRPLSRSGFQPAYEVSGSASLFCDRREWLRINVLCRPNLK
jgi:hypothetical protein